MTDTILRAALSAIRDLEDAGILVQQVGVNFAQSDLEDPQLITRILWALDQFDLQPDRLSVEVLENVLVQDAASPVRNSVNTLAKLGSHIIGRPMPFDQLLNWARQYQQSPHPHASPAKLA